MGRSPHVRMRDIGQPQMVWPVCGELPIDQIRRSRRGPIGCGGALPVPTLHASQAKNAPQPFHRAAGDLHALAAQLCVDAVGAVGAEAGQTKVVDLLDQYRIAASTESPRAAA